MQEPCGPTSSQEPDLVTPQGLNAGEGPYWCPAGARASSHNSCWALHHRSPPGEKPPMCDQSGGQTLLFSCPWAQLCEVRTDYPSGKQIPEDPASDPPPAEPPSGAAWRRPM